MGNKGGHTDTDMGLEAIFKEVDKLKNMCVKVGVTEDVGSQTYDGGATLAQVAAWNELGVLGPPMSENGGGKWFIPPRPFIRGFLDGKREQIAKTMEKIGGLVMSGKETADDAIGRLGKFGEDGIRTSIRIGVFTPNASSTIARKGEGKPPLIDSTGLKKAIRYQIINKPASSVKDE